MGIPRKFEMTDLAKSLLESPTNISILSFQPSNGSTIVLVRVSTVQKMKSHCF